MHAALSQLHPYPFEKLAALKAGITPPAHLPHIALSIGEPQHPAPALVIQALQNHMDGLGQYPATKGLPSLRETMSQWCTRRFQLTRPLNPDTEILPVNGTREALFAFVQAVINPSACTHGKPIVISPNPFYQIYEGAAILAGAELHLLDCVEHNGFLPDFSTVPDAVWQRCQLVFICSPGNPTGAVMPMEQLQALIQLADQHDFIIASDECYSELYPDELYPPPGLLQAASAMGRHDYARCVVFHSLSKRSNVPGLRSGFVAGDANIIEPFLLYRTYHGCAMPVQHQHASLAAWQDEQHVIENRRVYANKFRHMQTVVGDLLPLQLPAGGFYFWAKTPGCDQHFARELFAQQHITVLPGSYLSREQAGHNPGAGYVRMALVASEAECADAAQRLHQFLLTDRTA